jgi:hypothetical protein
VFPYAQNLNQLFNKGVYYERRNYKKNHSTKDVKDYQRMVRARNMGWMINL